MCFCVHWRTLSFVMSYWASSRVRAVSVFRFVSVECKLSLSRVIGWSRRSIHYTSHVLFTASVSRLSSWSPSTRRAPQTVADSKGNGGGAPAYWRRINLFFKKRRLFPCKRHIFFVVCICDKWRRGRYIVSPHFFQNVWMRHWAETQFSCPPLKRQ